MNKTTRILIQLLVGILLFNAPFAYAKGQQTDGWAYMKQVGQDANIREAQAWKHQQELMQPRWQDSNRQNEIDAAYQTYLQTKSQVSFAADSQPATFACPFRPGQFVQQANCQNAKKQQWIYARTEIQWNAFVKECNEIDSSKCSAYPR